MDYDSMRLNHDKYSGDYDDHFGDFHDIQQDQPLPPLTGETRRFHSTDVSPVFEPRRPIYGSLTKQRSLSLVSEQVPNSHRKSKKSPLSDADRFNLSSKMTKKGPQKKATTVKRAKAASIAKENSHVARGRAAIGRDPCETPQKTSETESEKESSPESSTVLKKSGTKKGRLISKEDMEQDEREINLDPDLEELDAYLENKYESDKKIKKDDRMSLIVDLRTNVYVKQQLIYDLHRERKIWETKGRQWKRDLDQVAEEKDVLSEKLKAKCAENLELQQKLQRKLSLLTGKRKKISAGDTNKELLDLIETQCKGFLFSKCKFVNSDAQEANLARLMLHYGNIPEEHKSDKVHFIKTYSAHMRKIIFERRSYIQTEYRKIFFKSLEKKVIHPFPTVEELTKCIMRDIKSDREYEVFVFYCEELLGKMVGANEWAPKIRCFTTISDAIRQNTIDIPLISPSDEAFAVLVVDNCIERWTDEAKREAELPKDEPKQKKKNVDGKYTTSNAGQVAFGGWTQEGLATFNKLQTIAKEARKTETCKFVEAKCKAIMRQKHKFTAKTWEEQMQRKSNKKLIEDETGEEVQEKEVILADVEMIAFDD